MIAPEITGTKAKARPSRSASARISATAGWSGASPSGRLHMIERKPSAAISATSRGAICGETL